MKRKQKVLMVLFLIITIGTFLRLYDLEEESIWADEEWTLVDIQQPTAMKTIQTVLEREHHMPPLYFVLLYFWSKQFGVNEFGLRLFSAVFGVLSIFLIYKLGEIVYNRKVGLLSALILSFSMVNVLYSQEIRLYAFFSFLTLLSFFLFVRVLKKGKINDYVSYILVTAAALYTVHFALVVIFIQAFWVFLFREKYGRRVIKRFYLSQFLSLILFLPFIKHFMISVPEFYVINFLHFVDKYKAPEIFANITFTIFLVGLLFLMFVSVSFYLKKKFTSGKIKFKENVFLILFFLGIIIYMLNVKSLASPIFFTRYPLFLFPFLYIGLAKGITLIKKKQLKVILILLLLLVSCYSLFVYYPTVTKEEWRDSVKYIEENSKGKDVILFDGNYIVGGTFDYYYSGSQERIRMPAEGGWENLLFFIELQKSKLVDKEGIWLVLSHNYKNGNFYRDIFDQSYNRVLHKHFKGIEVYYYEVK